MTAWPAPDVAELGGWVLRHADGYSKRANSVQPAGTSSMPRAEVVAQCEAWYAERARPCIFRITPTSDPDLDGFLEGRGYRLLDRTAAMYRGIDGGWEDGRLRLRTVALGDWLELYARLSGMRGGPPIGLRRIVGGITAPRHLAALPARETRDWVACGMAVRDGTLVGLFDLVTHPDRRREGFGTELVHGLLRWGWTHGAREAYLQVMHVNEPAMALYERLGFTFAYDYWYRIRDAVAA